MGDLEHLIAALRLRVEGVAAVANSRDVAELFERRHVDVLRQIQALRANPEVDRAWFREAVDNRRMRSYDMTRDGFAVLTADWTGETGRAFNSAYIEAFNALNDPHRSSSSAFNAASCR